MRDIKRAVRRFVRLYWFWVSLGLILTELSVKQAYIDRGYKAYGGEWFVFPLIMIAGYLVNQVRMHLPEIIEAIREERTYVRRIKRNRRRVQSRRNPYIR